MSYRMAFIVNAVILAIFGVLFMVMPDFALAQFKSEVYVATLFMARIMGGAFLLIGLLLWFLKDLAVKTQKNIAYLLLAYSIIGFVMGLFGMTSVGVLRANGWILLVAFGLFTLVYGYILFLQPKPRPSESKSRTPRKPKETPSVNSGDPA